MGKLGLSRNSKIIVPLLMTFLSSSTLSFAWFTWHFTLGGTGAGTKLIPGKLNSSLSVQRWTGSAWIDVNENDPSTYLGEMDTISSLPEDAYFYIKFKATDTSQALYHYGVSVDYVHLSITNEDGNFAFEELNYYIEEPSQQAFDYYPYIGANGLNPTTVFANPSSMTSYQLTDENQYLAPNNFIASDSYLYVLFKVRLSEIQNMVDIIPVEYTPYAIDFELDYSVEVRTLDEAE